LSLSGRRQRRSGNEKDVATEKLTSSFIRIFGCSFDSYKTLTVKNCQNFIFCTAIIYLSNHNNAIWGHRPFCCTVFKSLPPPPNTNKFADAQLMNYYIFVTTHRNIVVNISCLVVNKLYYAIEKKVRYPTAKAA
jgi:hypothetical protein